MTVQQDILAAELTEDPLTIGYSGMSDAVVLNNLTTPNQDNWVAITGAEIMQAIDITELNALAVGDRANVDTVLSLSGEIATDPTSKARELMIDAFGGGSATITNLATVANQPVTRAQQLGIAGWVTEGRIAQARA